MIDKDDNGSIDQKEMQEVFASGSNFRKDFENFWLELCAEADTNNDGLLDYEEFERAMENLMEKKATY